MTETKYSKPFREMAERIERNPEGEFSGALVFVPPTGEVIAVQVNDPRQDLVAFLSLCLGKLQALATELNNQPQGQYPGQFPRR